jgi:hypothetical protein
VNHKELRNFNLKESSDIKLAHNIMPTNRRKDECEEHVRSPSKTTAPKQVPFVPCGESAPTGAPTMVKVACDAHLIPATTTLFVGGMKTEASVCARGHTVHSGMKRTKPTSLIDSYAQ